MMRALLLAIEMEISADVPPKTAAPLP